MEDLQSSKELNATILLVSLRNFMPRNEEYKYDLGAGVILHKASQVSCWKDVQEHTSFIYGGDIDESSCCISCTTDSSNSWQGVKRCQTALLCIELVKPVLYNCAIPFLWENGNQSFQKLWEHKDAYNPILSIDETHILRPEDIPVIKSAHVRIANACQQKDNTRITRALNLFWISHLTENYGVSSILLFSALEALFSTNRNEISHQLGERLAFFIEQSAEARILRYRTIKYCYGIRSTIVHGDTVNPKKVKDLNGREIDPLGYVSETTRKCLLKILDSDHLFEMFNGQESKLRNYYDEMVFGSH